MRLDDGDCPFDCLCDECRARRERALRQQKRKFKFDPPLEASHLEALARVHASIDEAMQPFERWLDEENRRAYAAIFPTGSRAGLAREWTRSDIRFLQSLGIAPWH